MPANVKTAVVTGASAGIGEATARALAAAGFHVVLGARRLDRLRELAGEIGGAGQGGATALPLDVTDAASVEAFAGQVPQVDLLVNNAGAARGLDPLAAGSDDDWGAMWENKVLRV